MIDYARMEEVDKRDRRPGVAGVYSIWECSPGPVKVLVKFEGLSQGQIEDAFKPMEKYVLRIVAKAAHDILAITGLRRTTWEEEEK